MMNVKITIFDLATGVINRRLSCQDIDVQMQVGAGEGYINGDYDDSVYVIQNGQPVAKPPPAPPAFSTLKAEKSAQIDGWRATARYQNVIISVGGVSHIWQADQGSQDLLSNAVNLAVNGIVPSPPSWRTADNIDVNVTLPDLKNIAAAMAAQTSAAFYHSFQLKGQVNAATTQAQLDAIIW